MKISTILRLYRGLMAKFLPEDLKPLMNESILNWILSTFNNTPFMDFLEYSFSNEKDTILLYLDAKGDILEKKKFIQKQIKNEETYFENENILWFYQLINYNIIDILNDSIGKIEIVEGVADGRGHINSILNEFKEILFKGGLIIGKGDLATHKEKMKFIEKYYEFENKNCEELRLSKLKKEYDPSRPFIEFLGEEFGAKILFFHYKKKYHEFLKTTLVTIDENDDSKIFQPIPDDYEKININRTEKEIEYFFSFLFKEIGANGKPFLSELEVKELFRFGFTVPPSSGGKYYTLNFSGRKNSKAAFLYAVYVILTQLEGDKDKSSEKNKAARFLKYYFNEFKNQEIDKIKNSIRGYTAKGKFDAFDYLDPKNKD